MLPPHERMGGAVSDEPLDGCANEIRMEALIGIDVLSDEINPAKHRSESDPASNLSNQLSERLRQEETADRGWLELCDAVR